MGIEQTRTESKSQDGDLMRHIFSPVTKIRTEVVTTESGNKLVVIRDKDFIDIASIEVGYCGTPQCFFYAQLDPLGIFNFLVQTKGWLGDLDKRHPDLYAAKLFKASVGYLNEQTEHRIKGIKGHWCRGDKQSGFIKSDNFQQFIEYLDEIKYPTIEDYKEAAKSTWTGIRALELGYRRVCARDIKIIKENGQIVVAEVIFRRRCKKSTSSFS